MPDTGLSLLDEVKLQAQVILPVLRSLRAEIGKDKADRIVGDAVDRDMLKDDGTVREYNVTRCQYAEFFRGLGEPELGAILLCDSDFHIAEIGGANVEFKRTQTIMQGAAYCDFRYRFK